MKILWNFFTMTISVFLMFCFFGYSLGFIGEFEITRSALATFWGIGMFGGVMFSSVEYGYSTVIYEPLYDFLGRIMKAVLTKG